MLPCVEPSDTTNVQTSPGVSAARCNRRDEEPSSELVPRRLRPRLLRPVLARSKNMPSHWVSQPLAVPGRVHEDCKVPVERFHDRTIRALSWRTYKSPSKYCKAAILGSFKPTPRSFVLRVCFLERADETLKAAADPLGGTSKT